MWATLFLQQPDFLVGGFGPRWVGSESGSSVRVGSTSCVSFIGRECFESWVDFLSSHVKSSFHNADTLTGIISSPTMRYLVGGETSKRTQLAKLRRHLPVKWHITKQNLDNKPLFQRKVLSMSIHMAKNWTLPGCVLDDTF